VGHRPAGAAGFAERERHVLTIALLVFVIALPLCANDIQVDKRTLAIDDSVTITVTLTDAFASADNLQIPLQNLVIDGSPSVSSEFAWINGQSSRRKIFRYSAHPAGPGPALIGPLTLRGDKGEVETLAPVAIQVLPDSASGSNDPQKILHELMATGRDPFFIVADADKSSVFVGEQVIVTWTLYNAANVQQEAIEQLPKLAGFWVEELDVRGQTPQQVVIGGMVLQKLIVRRVALFPLRSGALIVDPMSVEAQIMKRSDIGNPFGMFEGTVIDIHRLSSSLTIEARPLPAGPPVSAVGDVSLKCLTPVQKNGGPVSIDVIVSGPANLRAAPPPAFAEPLEGSMQITEGGASVDRHDEALMTRRWRFLIFPARSGVFAVPPLTMPILSSAGLRRELRCERRALVVEAADATAGQPHAPPANGDARVEAARRSLPLIGIVAGILIAIAIVWPRLSRASSVRRETKSLVRGTPSEVRIAVDEWLSAHGVDGTGLLRETSERGDAYRALRSLLDAAERDRFVVEPGELRGRVRDLVASV
jgi:hypothetical protein